MPQDREIIALCGLWRVQHLHDRRKHGGRRRGWLGRWRRLWRRWLGWLRRLRRLRRDLVELGLGERGVVAVRMSGEKLPPAFLRLRGRSDTPVEILVELRGRLPINRLGWRPCRRQDAKEKSLGRFAGAPESVVERGQRIRQMDRHEESGAARGHDR
jgi:hypothetical protein